MGTYLSRLVFIYRYTTLILSRLGFATLRGFRRVRYVVACFVLLRLVAHLLGR